MRILFLLALLTITGSAAHADFYRYQTEDGAEAFTNTPTTRDAVRILREENPPRSSAASPRKKPAVNKAAQTVLKKPFPGQNQGDELLAFPVAGTVSSPYGWRHDPVDGNLRHHNGVDIAVPAGTAVKSVAPGRVSFSGSRGGYGNLVIIEHYNGMVSLYGHNSLVLVAAGEEVDALKTIALSGSTGRSTGPHLHFELWKDGNNLTREYVQNRGGNITVAGDALRLDHRDEIRRFVEENGTLVFTNLPQ
jgi:murein DD-endopeptidase MepM/ murein hydrolase activator NlpD